MLKAIFQKAVDAKVPLPVFVSSMLLMCLLAISFGWLVMRAEIRGSQSVPFGTTALAVASLPSKLEPLAHTVRTWYHGVNPQIQVRYLPRSTEGMIELPVRQNVPAVEGPKIRTSGNALPGWRVIVGYFRVGGRNTASALLLDREMRLAHVWALHEKNIDHPLKRGADFKFPHGFEIFPDGSILHGFDGGVSLKRVGFCGETLWDSVGFYHHSIALDEDHETLWTLRHTSVARARATDFPDKRLIEKMDAATGETLQTISLAEIIEANPQVSIFHTRKGATGSGPIWVFDPFHENDVEPLPASLAPLFPQFSVGDLLLSVRNPNLVLVFNPDSKRIKWWRVGIANRQHDPDWLPNGRIGIYDNNTGRKVSHIVEIDPKTMEHLTAVDGKAYDFYSHARGKHQVLPDGTNLVTSTYQGRILEISPEGKIVFEMVNFAPGETKTQYQLSEARWLPPDFFDFESIPECE